MISRSVHTLLVSIMAFVLVAAGAAADAAVTDLGPVRSLFEVRTATKVKRDCGFSRALRSSGESLWLFCDTVVSPRDGRDYLLGSSAATTAPTGAFLSGRLLRESPPPPTLKPLGQPTPFFPIPQAVRRANGRSCASGVTHYPVSWTTGIALQPSGRLLLPYVTHCVDGRTASIYFAERFGMAEYDPATNTLVRDAPKILSGRPLVGLRQLGSPVLRGGFLYLFASQCSRFAYGECRRGSVIAARVTMSGAAGSATPQWMQASAYRYFDGRAFGAQDSTRARSIVPASASAAAATIDDYRAKDVLAMVESTGNDGQVRVLTATHPRGPWTLQFQARLPGCRPGRQSFDFCRGVIGHPELSTSRRLVLSYYRPATKHVELVALPW